MITCLFEWCNKYFQYCMSITSLLKSLTDLSLLVRIVIDSQSQVQVKVDSTNAQWPFERKHRDFKQSASGITFISPDFFIIFPTQQ